MKDKIVLNPKDLLVKPVEDYWTKQKAYATQSEKGFSVGTVEHVGKEIPTEWIGKIVYYHTGMGTKLDIKGIGVYELISEHTKLMVRMDQTKENY